MSLPPAFLARPLAHRALHDTAEGRPENSRAAMRAAIAAGYGIEMDLQLSADGVPMVFHDYDLARLTGETGPLATRTAAELGRIRLRHGDEGIPTLAEVLALVAGRAPLLIEIKDQDGALGPDVGRLEEATAQALAGYDDPVAVMSFNPHSMGEMASLAPAIPRGLTTCAFPAADWLTIPPATRERLAAIPDYARTGACFISHEAADLGNPRVAELKAAGAAILCWTIRTPAQEAEARKVAQNITFEGYLP
ncbi:MAG: phosphodiesterase [Limimaricola sp.]|uniref:glycerophosphodiester phosphodiesterase family protein n=1 Tax=Limimaricola sp. TaxID=2211665 RepID=UPI001DF14DD2|nr:glycerophosphodiester phosphodiesterase family protein [Limimaricola sp.]MBI1418725.1 phosphodiesterase [Limimaricola sp.]